MYSFHYEDVLEIPQEHRHCGVAVSRLLDGNVLNTTTDPYHNLYTTASDGNIMHIWLSLAILDALQCSPGSREHLQ